MSGDRALPKGYELVSVLGAGGFGEVLLARQSALNRLVAVKRLHGHALAAPEDLERFRREAQVLAALKHPAIVRVYDFRRNGTDATLVMEYVEGASLAGLLEQGLTAPAALKALSDVAEALHAAADHRVVHRDVKPDNVFVLADGHAKLGDFGLARAVADPAVFRTTDNDVRCTPAYFAPELGQQLSEPDERSDAYAFAVMAYEVLTGRLPYDDVGGLALITAHWTREPPDPATFLPGFPPKATSALLAGLAKEPATRLLPRELVARLQAVPEQAWPRPATKAGAAARTIAASRASPLPPPPANRRRRWPVAVISLAVLAAAGALLLPRHPATNDLAVRDLRLTVTPPGGAGHCPQARFVFLATLTTNGGAGTLRYRWTRPDGQQPAQSSLSVPNGQRTVTTQLVVDLTGRRPLTGAVTLHLLAPVVRDATFDPIHYSC